MVVDNCTCTSNTLPLIQCAMYCTIVLVVLPYDAVTLCPPDLVLLVRSGPVIRDLGGSVRIWGDNAPVLISYFYDGAAPVKVFQNRSQSGFYMDNVLVHAHVYLQVWVFNFSNFVNALDTLRNWHYCCNLQGPREPERVLI